MANLFYAIFGVCRQRGGTKKKCYTKAIETIQKTTKKRKRKAKRTTKKRKTSKRRRR